MLLSINNTADLEQMPLYLETQNKKNVSIYEKYGFKLIQEELLKAVLKNKIYFMLRKADKLD